jgi:hypothetical protein
VERRVSLPSERFREFQWSPEGGRLAALSFRQLVIADAGSGAVDTLGFLGVQQMAWSPGGRWIGARATPVVRASGRERRSVVIVIDTDGGGDQPRVRALSDTTSIRSELRRTLAWAGPDLLAVCQDSVWTMSAVAPGALPAPGTTMIRTATPRLAGAGDRLFLGVVTADGRIEERELPPPPTILTDFSGRADAPVPLWWFPTRLSRDGAHLLIAAREPTADVVYMILATDGRVEHRFADGLIASDLSADGKWVLSQAETAGTQKLDGSELFLVRVSDGRAFPLTGTMDTIETDAVFEPGGTRLACLDQKDGSILIGRIEGLPTP